MKTATSLQCFFLLASLLAFFAVADANRQIESSNQMPQAADQSFLPKILGGGSAQQLLGRDSWPELVGVTGEQAKNWIKQAMPGKQVSVIPNNRFETADFNPDRVRVFVDSFGRVVRPPVIG